MNYVRNLCFIFTALTLSLGPGMAAASPCIEVDQTKDTLTAQEQKAAINTFEAVLSNQGVSSDNCTPFVIAHSRLGDVITVQVSRGEDIRTLRAETLSDLPAAYDQIVISFMSGEPLTKSVRRNNVMQSQSKREKEAVDSLFFFGFSGTGSSLSEEVMPGFHLLTRFETDAHAFGFGLDLSVGTEEQTTDAFSSRTTGAARWSFGLDYAYFFAPLDSSSFYAGTGLGYSGDVVGSRSGAGFYASPTLGMEFFRTSAARVSMELRSMLPFYQVESSSDSAKWNPGISLILRVGWDVPPEWILYGLLS